MQSSASDAAFMPLFHSSRDILMRLQCSSVYVLPPVMPKPATDTPPLAEPMQVSLDEISGGALTLGTFLTV